jgi:hypothetical protein
MVESEHLGHLGVASHHAGVTDQAQFVGEATQAVTSCSPLRLVEEAARRTAYVPNGLALTCDTPM